MTSSKVAIRVHARRGRTDTTLCGRRIVGGDHPRPEQVRSKMIAKDLTKVTCGSCRNNSVLKRAVAG